MIKHLACIMDGNRRWAKRNGWLSLRGHQEGLSAAQRVVDFCLEKQISYLSLYAFSIENFRRSDKEKEYLFNLMITELEKRLEEFIVKGVRVRFIGERELFPVKVKSLCEKLERETEHLTKLNLNLLFGYGARQEIIAAMKVMVQKIATGELSEGDISHEMLLQHMWMSDIPDPELIIRTGGVNRLSNFLLYQAAYSELYFLDCLWPDITKDHFEKALEYYKNCQRNFGV